jgi:hypothetical protein
MGGGIGRKIEQLLCRRNKPNLSEATSDWSMAWSLRGRGKKRLLSLAYLGHWNKNVVAGVKVWVGRIG